MAIAMMLPTWVLDESFILIGENCENVVDLGNPATPTRN